MSATFSIIEAENKNQFRDVILRLWERNLLNYPLERFRWLYERNPKGKVLTWLASCDQSGAFVGCASAYPCPFFIDGKEVKTLIAVDFGVDQEHRVFGPALLLQKAILSGAEKRGFSIVFVYPDKASSGVFRRAGFIPIGSSSQWIKILDCRYKISKFLNILFIAGILGSIVNACLTLMELLWNGARTKFGEEVLDRCDARFDALWKSTKDSFAILADHSAAYLDWRFSDYTTMAYRYFCLFDKSRKDLKGYLIFGVKNKEVIIKDIFPPNAKMCNALLGAFSRRMRGEKMHFIVMSYFGNPAVTNAIKRAGFLRRQTRRDYLIYFTDSLDKSEKKRLLDAEKYNFFYG